MIPLYDCHTHIGVELSHYLTGAFPYCQHFCELCRDLDAAGIGQVVVFPMVSHLAIPLDELRRGGVEVLGSAVSTFPYEFENRHFLAEIYDLFPDLAPRAVPLAMIDPTRQAGAQIAHLTALAERYPIAGLKLQGTMIRSFVKDLPASGFLDLAAERDWPVLIHSAVHPDDPWSRVDDILDVVEATPRVRFNVAHTLRFDLPGLERLGTLPNAWCDVSALCIHCDLATGDSPVVAAAPRRLRANFRDPGDVLRVVAERWPDKMLWGSDAPYYSYVAPFTRPDGTVELFDLRSSMSRETTALRSLPEALLERIAGTNPRAWLYGETP